MSLIENNFGLARTTIAACVVSLTLVGCAERHPVRIATPPTIDAISAWVVAVNAALTTTNTGAPATPIEKRNKALSYSEALVMARYGETRKVLVKGRAITEISFDVLNLGLAGTVPIVNGARGKTILGALATGFLGIQKSVDKNLFQQQTTAALLSAMDSCVIKESAVIDGHRALDISQYDEYGVYADLVGLYGCTTLPGAIQELTETQSAASKETKENFAPVTEKTLAAFGAIQAAFAESAKSDRVAAIKFLKLLKVGGVTDSSTEAELLVAYQGLLPLAAKADFRKKMQDAANKSGLITPDE
jgi:hypothetical protein